MSIFSSELIAPPYFEDEEESRLAALLNAFLLVGLAIVLVSGVITGLVTPDPAPRFTLHLILIVVFLGSLMILHLGHLRIASRTLVYPLWLALTLVIIVSGGISSPNITGYILMMFMAGILAGERDGLLVSALSVFATVVIVSLMASGIFPSPVITYSLVSAGIVICIYFGFAALLIHLTLSSRARAVASVRERDQENRIITEETLAGVYIIQGGVVAYGNPSLMEIMGYEKDELVGIPLEALIHPDDHQLVADNINSRLADPELRPAYTVRGLRKDGTTVYCEVMGRAADYRGKPAIIGTLLDVTERVQAEAAVRASEELYRSLVENVRDVIFLLSPDGVLTSLNPAFEEITGWPRDKWIGRQFASLIHEDDLPAALNLLETALTEDPPRLFELRVKGQTGEFIHSEFLVTSYIQNGIIEGVLGIGRNITDRKRAELEREHLLIAEHDQRLMAETLAQVTLALAAQSSLPDVLDEILHQARLIVAYKTANIALLDGGLLHTVRWQGYENFESEHFMANWTQSLVDFPVEQEAVRTGRPIAIYETHDDGRWRIMDGATWIHSFLVVPIRLHTNVLGLLRLDGEKPGEFSAEDGERLGALANAAAIAIQNARLKDEIQTQALQLQHIVDTVTEGIFLLDADQTIRLANPAAKGYLKDLVGLQVGDTLTHLADCSTADLLIPTSQEQEWRELALPDNQREFAVMARPLVGEPKASGWVIVLREVTEERERQQYIQAQERLATVGQMAAGIAHDFNNILAVIELYAQMVLYTSSLSPKDRERIEVINQQSQRAATLIRQILDFSRRSLMEFKPMPLLPFLKESIRLLERTLPETILVGFRYEKSGLDVSADPGRLQQGLMNLALNARDAMPEGGKLSVGLGWLFVKADDKRPLPDMSPGEWAVLSISDTGHGIDSAHLDHIFEPFFTTKPPGQGTGLGLAQVYGIVRQHEGFIDVASEVGVGTTFTIYLPLIKEEIVESQEESTAPMGGAGETILVVEDDAVAREAVSDVLQLLGYQVEVARNGLEALEHFNQNNGQVDLVISDLVMPGMSGRALHEWMLENRPKVKMIAVTGYPLEEDGKTLLRNGIVAWIQKPFTAEKLAQAVADSLEPAGETVPTT